LRNAAIRNLLQEVMQYNRFFANLQDRQNERNSQLVSWITNVNYRRHSQSSNLRRIAVNHNLSITYLDLWLFNPKTIPLVGYPNFPRSFPIPRLKTWDLSFLSYVADKQTDKQTASNVLPTCG